jgi:phosphate transport system permease protein
MKRRDFEERVARALMLLSALVVLGSLFALLAIVVLKGISALSISMITETPSGGYYFGKGGGILNAILGSLYLAGGATVLALLISLPTALYLNEYATNSKTANIVRLCLDVLWGIPSIVYGAFAFTIMLYLSARASLFWGIITVTLFVFPIMTRAMDESIRIVPHRLKEGSYALGSTRLETATRVVVRQAMPGILTAVLLGFGRGIGDAASVLFTAGYTDSIPRSLFQPVATLPLAVFFQLTSPVQQVQQRAYASAIILLILVLIASLVSRISTRKLFKYVVS